MTAPGDLVVLCLSEVAWAEVADGVYEFPTPIGSRTERARVFQGEHGIVREISGRTVRVFWPLGHTTLHVERHLRVVASPLPPADLTALFGARTV